MSRERGVGFLGFGHAVPPHVRTNDDPIFREVREGARSNGVSEVELFTGMRERRYLGPGERLEPLMVEAGRQALARAGVAPGQVDRLYGYATVSEMHTPNALFSVHRDLGLPAHTLVLPINSEFTNFLTGCLLAWEAIAMGHGAHALVVCGGNWTRHMDYRNPHSLVCGDGAGAAVLGRGGALELVDHAVHTRSDIYEAMGMRSHATDTGLSVPTYAIAAEGVRAFMELGMNEPPRLIAALLERHGLRAEQLTLVTHQASRRLMDQWKNAIQPGAYLDTFDEYGNLGLASIPVTLSRHAERLTTDYVTLIALGTGLHVLVLLLRRTGGV